MIEVLGNASTTSHLPSTFGALLFRTKSTEISIDAYKKQKNINAIIQWFMDEGVAALTGVDLEKELTEIKKDKTKYDDLVERTKVISATIDQQIQTPRGPVTPRGPITPRGPVDRTAKREVSHLIQLPWHKISEHKIKKSIWNSTAFESVTLDIEEIERAFAAKVTLINPIKESDLEGFLSFMSWSDAEIRTAILEMDQEKLSAESIKELVELAPTKDEFAILLKHKDNKANLTRAEQFYLEV